MGEIKKGDLVVVLDRMDRTALGGGEIAGVDVTSQMAWLWGAIVGDGTVYRNSIRVCAFNDFADQVTQALRDVYGVRAYAHHSAGLIAHGYKVSTSLLSQGFWRRGEEKRVPEAVWSWPTHLRMAFCSGYAAADGYFDARGCGGQRYDSCSRLLIDEVRSMHIEAGHRITNVSTNMRDKPIFIKGRRVKDAKPLHNFVVSSIDGEPYSNFTKNALRAAISGGFGLRVVLRSDNLPSQRVHDVITAGSTNAIIDGVPTWAATVPG